MLPDRKRDVSDVLAERLYRNLAAFPPEWRDRLLRLVKLRSMQRQGLTKKQAAGVMGIHPRTLVRDERDVRAPLAGRTPIRRDAPTMELDDA
jgi:hypothetical protein